MSGIRAAKKRETRQAILQAAIRLFAERGFEGTCVDDLAREAGIGKGTIYGYFRTKEEIFLAFCEEEIDFAFAELARRTDPDAPILDQLLTLFMSQFRFLTENREFGRLLIREMAFPRDATSARSKELDARYLDAVGRILTRAGERGELRDGFDAFLTPVHFYALYLVALSGWYTGYVTSFEEVEESLRILFRQALTGLGAQEPQKTILSYPQGKTP